MISFLFALSAILIVAISYLAYRIINKAFEADLIKSPIQDNNKLNAYLCLGFLATGLGAFIYFSFKFRNHLLPEVASLHGRAVDSIFWITLILTGIIFFLTQILLFFFANKYRFSSTRRATYYTNNFKLELIWTIIPAITFIFLFIYGQRTYLHVTRASSSKAVTLEIMAEQFNWRIRYPGQDKILGKYNFSLIDEINDFGLDFSDKANLDDFTPLQIHIPRGREVVFKIRSRDVIHSVFIPYFRLKMDAVPSMPTEFHFTPTISTAQMRRILHKPDFNYELACAELCGRGHFAMLFIVVVDEEKGFDKWYESQPTWLSQHKDYLEHVPANNKSFAMEALKAEESKTLSQLKATEPLLPFSKWWEQKGNYSLKH